MVVPLNLLARSTGSTVVREDISTDTVSESVLLTSLSSNQSIVYILTESLSAATLNGGGEGGEFRAVFQDEVEMNLLPAASTLVTLGTEPGSSYIVGSDGVVIEGYSDDATLKTQGYVTDKAIAQRRRGLTANRVLVSVAPGDAPTEHQYATTYVVGEGAGARNVEPGGAEYCTEGFLTFTYDEDR